MLLVAVLAFEFLYLLALVFLPDIWRWDRHKGHRREHCIHSTKQTLWNKCLQGIATDGYNGEHSSKQIAHSSWSCEAGMVNRLCNEKNASICSIKPASMSLHNKSSQNCSLWIGLRLRRSNKEMRCLISGRVQLIFVWRRTGNCI